MFALLENEARLSPRRLSKRVWELREFIEVSDGAVDNNLLVRASGDLDRVEERAQLGAQFTVAALVGGTGSGKSTLFNALTGFDFADAGEIRPTTERATACTWRAQADDLLDHLDIDKDRRIEHDSILMPVSDDLEGLVLLDLPDYDSVRFANSLTVTRLMPMLDVLIWVVDPQKYADQLLHRDYLENLQARSRQMIVVMNHIDTVFDAQVPVLMADLRRLLDADGLKEVPAYPISALECTGLEPLLEHLREAVSTPSTNLVTAASQVDQISRLLSLSADGTALSSSELQQQKAEIVEHIMRASGVPTVLEQIRLSGNSLTPVALSAPVQPAPTLSVAIRDAWVARASANLPLSWAALVGDAIAPADSIRRRVASVYSKVELPQISRMPVWNGLVVALVLSALGILGAMFGVPFVPVIERVIVFLGALAVSTIIYFWGKSRVRKQAADSALAYREALYRGLADVVQEQMIDGVQEVLDRFQRSVDLLNH